MLFKYVKRAFSDRSALHLWHNCWLHIFLLLLSTVVGAALRLTNLTEKTIWSDEFSTIVFSLGNSFKTVPVNQLLAPDRLLEPIVPNPNATALDTVRHLFTESTHPPLFFILNHWWLQLFPSESGLVSLWGARSLSAFLGILSIPATFFLGWLTFRSAIAAQLSAALMVVSPFGVALSQDARHYTLAILWVAASISCFIIAIRCLTSDRKLPAGLLIIWILANCLGVATHYFVILTLAGEAVVLAWLKWRRRWQKTETEQQNWLKIYGTSLMTLVGCSVWIFVWLHFHDRTLINWIYGDEKSFLDAIAPVAQLPLAWLVMLFLLPIENQKAIAVIISGFFLLALFSITVYILVKAWRVNDYQEQRFPELKWLGALISSIMAIFLVLTYAKFSDLTSAIRYNFTYFPAFIVFVSGCLSLYLQLPQLQAIKLFKNWIISSKSIVLIIWLMGLVGSLLVVSGVGFQKPYRPDLLAEKITQLSPEKTLVTIFHHSHIQTSKMMGLVWEIKNKQLVKDLNSYQFLLNNPQCQPPGSGNCLSIEKSLFDTVNKMPKPLDVWLVDYHSPDFNIGSNCIQEPQQTFRFPGLKAKRYRCLNSE